MTPPMTEPDTARLAEAVLAAIVGQECTLVQDSYAEQFVVGFGSPTRAEWPLRETMRAPWLVRSRYGKWRVTDGVRSVATDEESLDDAALQRTRAVLLHQHVANVKFDIASPSVDLTLENGAQLAFFGDEASSEHEDAWTLQAPGGLVIEAWPGRLVVTRTEVDSDRAKLSALALVHKLIRDVAKQIGLVLFEPPEGADPGFDAVLAAPNGTVLLVQVKSTGKPSELGIRAVTVRKDASPPTSTDISLADLTADVMTEHVRRLLSAA